MTGKKISYVKDGKNYSGTVVKIDNDAHLVINNGEFQEILSYGEIQIIGMEQLAI